ncbi:TatD family hydrolase [bacterium]|nr:TatD family hydrolase [candidate division CSSED10-310 bacterium]
MIDTHAHLMDQSFDSDRGRVIRDAFHAGLQTIVTIASNFSDSDSGAILSRDYPGLYYTIGLHPHEADSWHADTSRQSMKNRIKSALAVGEIGLDYFYHFSDPTIQKQVFLEQFQLAMEFNKPVVIHCREAFSDLRSLLGEWKNAPHRGVIHCFTGTIDDAEYFLNLGYFLGFGGMLTFSRSDHIRTAAGFCPLDRLLPETDCPYLSPIPLRGTRNEPAHIIHVYRALAKLKHTHHSVLCEAMRNNFNKCFSPSQPATACFPIAPDSSPLN